MGEYDLNNLNQIDLIVEPFKNLSDLAHIMLAFFCFGDQDEIIVLVKVRKERDEEYRLIAGVSPQFE